MMFVVENFGKGRIVEMSKLGLKMDKVEVVHIFFKEHKI